MVTKGSAVTIVPYCVNNGLMANFDLEHGRPQDMASIVSFDLQVCVHLPCHHSPQVTHHYTGTSYLDCLVEVDCHHLLHAVLDHLRCKEVLVSLPLHSNLPVVLLHRASEEVMGSQTEH